MSAKGTASGAYGVIIAGGKGTRLWPLSRSKAPKQLLNLCSTQSLIRQTIARCSPPLDRERLWVVTRKKLLQDVRGHLIDTGVPRKQIIADPVPRSTAPCIGLMSVWLEKLSGRDAVMVVMWSDHWIDNARQFRRTVRAAIRAARGSEQIVVVGVEPRSPNTGYGYIQVSDSFESFGGLEFFRVRRFVEKPRLELAKRYIASGTYLWNMGMIVARVGVLLDQFKKFLPEMEASLREIQSAIGTPLQQKVIEQIYPRLEEVPIDTGLLERSKNVITCRAPFKWTDIGDWEMLFSIWGKQYIGNHDVVALDAEGINAYVPDKLVAVVGVDHLTIVEAGDVLLICDKHSVTRVKDLVDKLEKDRKQYKKYL